MGTLPLTAGRMGRGSGKKEKNLNELKQELEIDVHKVSVDELCKRFNSNVAEGLNDDQVAKGIKEHGLNQLPPPPTTPEWIKSASASSQALPCSSGLVQSSASLHMASRQVPTRSPRMITSTSVSCSPLSSLSLASFPIIRKQSLRRSWRASRTWCRSTRWFAGTVRRSR